MRHGIAGSRTPSGRKPATSVSGAVAVGNVTQVGWEVALTSCAHCSRPRVRGGPQRMASEARIPREPHRAGPGRSSRNASARGCERVGRSGCVRRPAVDRRKLAGSAVTNQEPLRGWSGEAGSSPKMPAGRGAPCGLPRGRDRGPPPAGERGDQAASAPATAERSRMIVAWIERSPAGRPSGHAGADEAVAGDRQ